MFMDHFNNQKAGRLNILNQRAIFSQKQSVKYNRLKDEKANWVALWSINGIGRKTWLRCTKNLKKMQVSWQEFWVNDHQIWKYLLLTEKQQLSIKKFINEHNISEYYQSLISEGISVLSYQDRDYPDILQPLTDKPLILFVKSKKPEQIRQLKYLCSTIADYQKSRRTDNKNQIYKNKDEQGKKAIFTRRLSVGIVGTRKLTIYGKTATEKICYDLALTKTTIVSGFMYGVDLIAHQSALKYHTNTIAVLGYGYQHIFPASFHKIFAQMLDNGAIFLTEYAPHISAHSGNFPVRNRIVAGLSSGIVVTEAALKSGSHLTAQWALEYGREVFAVPGPINNPYSEGTKKLINDGAILITRGEDIINELYHDPYCLETKQTITTNQNFDQAFHPNQVNQANECPNQNQDDKILTYLKIQALTVDQLAEITRDNPGKLIAQLNLLQIEGLVNKEGDYWHYLLKI